MNISKPFRADLHCHSTFSDGTFSPQELVDHALAKNLQGLSITDHDTIEAYREVLPYAKKCDLLLISGVELSALHRTNKSVHILGYGFDVNSTVMHEFCFQHLQRRQKRLNSFLEKLEAHHLPLTLEEIKLHSRFTKSIGRPHIALAMMAKGYVKSVQEAFQLYLGDDKCCYVTPHHSNTVEETIDVIHQAKGIAILAHPHLIYDSQILHEVLQMNFDGIEGYYARFPLTANERWLKLGHKKEWIITGGSDFHGSVKPNLALGSSWVNQDTFDQIYKHFLSNQTNISEF